MNIAVKSLRNGFRLPAYGLGTWQMGGRQTRDQTNDDSRDVAAIRAAVDAGVTHIDTAERYAEGHAETLVGEAIRGYDRSLLTLVSKAGPESISEGRIEAAAEASLRRMGVEYLDLYLLHVSIPEVDPAEQMAQMDRLVERGLVRHIGVSNFSVESMAKAQAASANPIVCNQVHYNLKFREPESTGLLEYCQQNDVLLNAWRPLQYGELIDSSIPVLVELSEKYDATPAQVAINWLTSQANVVAIAKTSNVAHLEENLASLRWEMEAADVERLRNEFPNQERYSDRVRLA